MEESPIYAKKEVNYRHYKEGDEGRCASCRFFVKTPMFQSDSCELVKGKIKADDTCNLWTGDSD